MIKTKTISLKIASSLLRYLPHCLPKKEIFFVVQKQEDKGLIILNCHWASEAFCFFVGKVVSLRVFFSFFFFLYKLMLHFYNFTVSLPVSMKSSASDTSFEHSELSLKDVFCLSAY